MARRNKLDYFPFFPKDCEADETIRLMDDAEFGFWMRLCCRQWPNGGVPDDVESIVRGTPGTAPGGAPRTPKYVRQMLDGNVGKRLLPHPSKAGVIADPRLLKERVIAEGYSAASGVANKARWGSNRTHEQAPDSAQTGSPIGTDKTHESDSGCSVSVSVSNYKDPEWNVEEAFCALWEAYPAKGRVQRHLAEQYFIDRVRTPETCERVMEAIRGKWTRSAKWAKGFVLALPKWIDQECWNEEPEPAEAAKDGGPVYRKWVPPTPTE